MSSIPFRQRARKASILLGGGIAMGAVLVGISIFLGDLRRSNDTVKSDEDKLGVVLSAPARKVQGSQSEATTVAVSKPADAGKTAQKKKVEKQEPDGEIATVVASEPAIAEVATVAAADESGAAGAATGAGYGDAGSGSGVNIGGGFSAPTASGGFQASGGSGSAGRFNAPALPRAMPRAPTAPMAAAPAPRMPASPNPTGPSIVPPVAGPSPLTPTQPAAPNAPAVPIPSPGVILTAAAESSGGGTPGGAALPPLEILRPGHSPGTAWENDLTKYNAIEIEIAGSEDGQYDVVHVTGPVASFPEGFKISFILLDAYVPASGADFEFLFANALEGEENISYFFDPKTSVLPIGFGYQVYVDSGADLHVRFYDATSPPPQGYVHDLYTGRVDVPEPSTAALALLGLALLGSGGMRRRVATPKH